MSEPLSNYEIAQGRKIYDIYNGINSFSFALLTGNVITLYALLLGANSTLVGLLTAFMYLSYFVIPVGKLLAKRFTIVRIFAYTWFLRNIGFMPVVVIPFVLYSNKNGLALLILTISVAIFNFFRGAGMISYNPVTNLLAPGKDRSSFIVRISLANNGAVIIATLALYFFLTFSQKRGINNLDTYYFSILAGIIFGFIASALLLKLPDPDFQAQKEIIKKAKAEGKTKKEIRKLRKIKNNEGSGSFTAHVKDALKDKNFVVFITAFFIIQFAISLARPFLIVYGKAVYSMPENIVIILSVCASIGALIAGLIMRLIIDRLGAKPVFIILTILSLASLIPAIIAPFRNNHALSLIFLIIFSIFVNMGFIAQLDAASAYFFTMVPKSSLMNLSMLYYYVLGITGGIGSILGGQILDRLSEYGLSNLLSYRLFFSFTFVLIIVGMFFQAKLLNLGGKQVFETIAVLFSPRDMRALSVLHKLDTNKSLKEEHKMIGTLANLASSLSADEIAEYLHSPRIAIRMAALNAMLSMNQLTTKNREAVLDELKNGEFTTASLAAKILGKFKAYQAIPQLRKSLNSCDFNVAGESMIALAKMNDISSQFAIAKILNFTENPSLLISGMEAMEIYNSHYSIPLVLDILRRDKIPTYIADEAFLVLSGILNFQTNFYYSYNLYKNKSKSANAILTDQISESFAKRKKEDMEFKNITLDFFQKRQTKNAFINKLLDDSTEKLGLNAAILTASIIDRDLIKKRDFRFFLCCWAISLFENPKLFDAQSMVPIQQSD